MKLPGSLPARSVFVVVCLVLSTAETNWEHAEDLGSGGSRWFTLRFVHRRIGGDFASDWKMKSSRMKWCSRVLRQTYISDLYYCAQTSRLSWDFDRVVCIQKIWSWTATSHWAWFWLERCITEKEHIRVKSYWFGDTYRVLLAHCVFIIRYLEGHRPSEQLVLPFHVDRGPLWASVLGGALCRLSILGIKRLREIEMIPAKHWSRKVWIPVQEQRSLLIHCLVCWFVWFVAVLHILLVILNYLLFLSSHLIGHWFLNFLCIIMIYRVFIISLNIFYQN